MKIRELIRGIRQRGSFANELGISLSGGAISYLIGFLFTPFISRIFPPPDYGAFALLSSFSINLSLFASLGLSGAVLLPKSTRQLTSLLKVSFVLLFGFTLLLSLILLFYHGPISVVFNAQSLGDFWYLVPFLVFILHITNITQSLCVRYAEFGKDAISKIISIFLGKSSVLMYGLFISPTFLGLALGEIFLRSVQVMYVTTSKQLLQVIANLCSSLELREFKHILKEYKNYPLYFMPSNWLNLMVGQLPLYFIASIYGGDVTGNFSFAAGILNLPIIIVGYSFSQVLFRKNLVVHESGESLFNISKKSLTILLLIGLVPFGLIYFFGKEIYVFLLGNNWELSGLMAEILSPYYFIQFTIYPFLSIFRVFRIEKFLLIINAFILLFLSVGLYLFANAEVLDFVKAFSIVGSFSQILVAVFIYFIIKRYSHV